MKVTELTRGQLAELKQRIMSEEGCGWLELATANETITDSEVFWIYEGVEFTGDDFFCTAI